MKFFTQKTILFSLLFLTIYCSVFGITTLNQNKYRTIHVNGKEIKFSVLPNSVFPVNGKMTAKDVLKNVTSNAFRTKQIEPVYYLLDSITNKDITLSPIADVESKIDYKYDALGRVVLEESKEYNSELNGFVVVYKTVYQYGEKSIIKLDYDYSNEETGFVVSKSTLDNSGNIIQEKYGNDSLNLESFVETKVYTYENNLLKTVITTLGESTFPHDKTEYNYDTKLRLDSVVSYTNNGQDSLIYDSKLKYKYDNSDNLLREDAYSWDEDWYSGTYSDYIFNSDNNCTDMVYTEPLGEDFIVSSAYKFEYNTAIKNSNIFSGSAFDEFLFSFQDQMISSKVKILLNNEALAEYESDMHYAIKVPTFLKNAIGDNKATLTYNTANKSLVVNNFNVGNVARVCIYDATGKNVLAINLNGGNSIDAVNLGKGLFIYSLIINGSTTTGKVLVN